MRICAVAERPRERGRVSRQKATQGLCVSMVAKRAKSAASLIHEATDPRCGKIYDLCLNTDKPEWFGLGDCAFRAALPIMYWYWAAIMTPINFFLFTLKYNMLWYGKPVGLILTAMYPILPVVLIVVELWKKVESLWKKDWSSAGAGAVFFVKPKGFLPSLLWQVYLNISMYVGLYIACGNDDDAIEHSWYDTHTHKDFWRGLMEPVGMRMPREMGRYTKGKLNVDHDLKDVDIVLKITDSYLGIGDQFLDFGKGYSGQADLERIFAEYRFTGTSGAEESYADKEVMVLELVRPDPTFGVHSFDILTMMTPTGPKVVSCLFWGDCTTSSSHSCTSGYTVDIETECIHGVAKWYSTFFATMEGKMVGTKLPGVKEACQRACAAHARSEYKFLKMVGWDSMITKEKTMVFFEGNFAAARLPRRMFLSFANLVEFVCNHSPHSWPFGKKA